MKDALGSINDSPGKHLCERERLCVFVCSELSCLTQSTDNLLYWRALLSGNPIR